ncbi:MAG: TolC family protein, partial [Deltaproteobacteria bacterium]|nr:TolC family protein [Deltaproteobacteria bacterium]
MSNIKIPFWKKFINLFAHHIKITIVLVILAGFTVFRLVNGQAALFDKSSELEAVYVELGAAHFGNMRELGRYYGSLSAPSHFVLSAKVGGEIKSLKVNIGDKLNNGELVAVIDDEEYVIARDRAAMAVKLAEAQLSEAEANLSLADSDLKRQTSLIEKNIVPHAEFEAAENRHLQAQARLAVAESQLQSASNQLLDAELKLSYTQVAASWPNGDSANENLDDFRYVGTRLVNEGQLVAPNSPLFDIVSLNPL